MTKKNKENKDDHAFAPDPLPQDSNFCRTWREEKRRNKGTGRPLGKESRMADSPFPIEEKQ